MILLPLMTGCVGPLVPVVKISNIPVDLKREVLAMPIYNESQLFQTSYSVINFVEVFPVKTKPGTLQLQKPMPLTKPNTGRTS